MYRNTSPTDRLNNHNLSGRYFQGLLYHGENQIFASFCKAFSGMMQSKCSSM